MFFSRGATTAKREIAGVSKIVNYEHESFRLLNSLCPLVVVLLLLLRLLLLSAKEAQRERERDELCVLKRVTLFLYNYAAEKSEETVARAHTANRKRVTQVRSPKIFSREVLHFFSRIFGARDAFLLFFSRFYIYLFCSVLQCISIFYYVAVVLCDATVMMMMMSGFSFFFFSSSVSSFYYSSPLARLLLLSFVGGVVGVLARCSSLFNNASEVA